MNAPLVAGVDLGSRTVKVVVRQGEEELSAQVSDTSADPLAVARRLLAGWKPDRVVATGYGRHLLANHFTEAEVITEIKAVALGAAWLHPGARLVVDVGGQDTKAVALDGGGQVRRFLMNDRCAAGTGRFLEVMAVALGLTPDEFVEAALAASRGESLSATCAVFAESEVVSLVARGKSRGEIALGIHQAVANRVLGLVHALGNSDGPVVLAGGGARNRCLVHLLTGALGGEVWLPPRPQLTAALGCVRYGQGLGRTAGGGGKRIAPRSGE